jgi:uncharacterized protein YeaO (DUF488 family)
LIRIKRVYEKPEASDGARFLVDRLWPRGITKENLHIDGWLKEAAPSDELRHWFGHDAARWDEFKERYFAELEGKADVLKILRDAMREGDITLLYGARDIKHNNAVALKAYSKQR